ncbi:MAG: YhcH/YjgK/YiaL family protein [Opitutaceae bacterium]|nr:YhcH/YjgK/YiaL family protein [Opitutaceae bacterium]
MACFGALTQVRACCASLPEFQAAFAYALEALTAGSTAHRRITALAEGSTHRQELAGGACAVEMAYRTKSRSEGFFETHRRYIDVQVIVTGEELMEVAAAAGLAVTQDYDEASDFIKYADTGAASVLWMRPGDAAVFWPEDAHMPSLAVRHPALVRKTVIKVPVNS